MTTMFPPLDLTSPPKYNTARKIVAGIMIAEYSKSVIPLFGDSSCFDALLLIACGHSQPSMVKRIGGCFLKT